jgi:pantoate--beta-alanine ligase
VKIIKKIEVIKEEISLLKNQKEVIGLVPTMGYFHEGHLSLIDIARKHTDIVVVSIFVNPTQFAPEEDFDRYPRDIVRDEKLAKEHGTDIIFYPEISEMYPQPFYTYVTTEKLSKVLCGRTRKTHFRGVTTVVAKLFNIVQPDIAFFGQKDAQQSVIIKRMVKDLNFPIDVIVGPTIREKDGLARSSRNIYLSPEERSQASIIYKALTKAKKEVEKGNRNAEEISKLAYQIINSAPLAQIEYVEIIDDTNLKPVKIIKAGTFLAIAVFFGKTRLIDNIYLMKKNKMTLDKLK